MEATYSSKSEKSLCGELYEVLCIQKKILEAKLCILIGIVVIIPYLKLVITNFLQCPFAFDYWNVVAIDL